MGYVYGLLNNDVFMTTFCIALAVIAAIAVVYILITVVPYVAAIFVLIAGAVLYALAFLILAVASCAQKLCTYIKHKYEYS